MRLNLLYTVDESYTLSGAEERKLSIANLKALD